MNLHNIVSGAIGAINPNVSASWQQSSGQTQGSDYGPNPTYYPAVTVSVQMQALTFRDLMMLDGINLNGEARAMYVNGDVVGVRRPDARGGDLFTLADGSVWLVTHVLENFNTTAGWTKVAVVRQMAQ